MIIIDKDKYDLLKKHLRDADTFTDNEIDAMMGVFTTVEKISRGMKTVADRIRERENT